MEIVTLVVRFSITFLPMTDDIGRLCSLERRETCIRSIFHETPIFAFHHASMLANKQRAPCVLGLPLRLQCILPETESEVAGSNGPYHH